MGDHDAIIRKITKLLKLADKARNNSEAEAEAALLKAQELMRQHGIEQSAVDVAGTEGIDLSKFTSAGAGITRRKFTQDDWDLANTVAFACHCQVVALHDWKTGKSRLHFVGHLTDAAIASAMFVQFRKSVRKVAAAHCKDREVRLYGREWKSFMAGFSWRLRQRVEEARQQADNADARGAALIVYRAEEAREAMHKMFPNLKEQKARKRDIDATSFLEGQDHAESVDIRDKDRLE